MRAIVCDFALCKSRHGPCRVTVDDDQAVANRSDKNLGGSKLFGNLSLGLAHATLRRSGVFRMAASRGDRIEVVIL
jgi:hypothetical protein